MNYDRSKRKFPAVLKYPDNKLIENGTACVFPEDGKLEFTSDFLPIFKMGTRLTVLHQENNLDVQVYEGEVYLSSRRLLRLVSLSDEVLPGAASLGAYDTHMTGRASIITPVPVEPPAKRFPLLPKPHPVMPPSNFPVSVYAVSLTQFKFTCDVALSQNQLLFLDIDHPIRLRSLPVRVELPVTLGGAETCSYRCSVRELKGNNFVQLEKYVRKLSLWANKMFPPAEEPPAPTPTIPTLSDGKNL